MTGPSCRWVVGIDYDEGCPGSYRAVVAERDGEVRRFEGKGPQGDWADYLEWASAEGILAITRSSVTHFCWDVPGWRFIEDELGREVLVPEDRPEWLGKMEDVQ